MFQWRDEYSVDGGIVDEEHKKLFELANRVLDVLDPKSELEDLTNAVKALFEYTSYHFEHEVEMMRAVGYPDLDAHIQLHNDILNKMKTILTHNKDIIQFTREMKHIMMDWVLQHIINEDSKAGKHARELKQEAVTP